MKKLINLLITIFLTGNLYAGFDFGNLTEDGSGSFNQPIENKKVKRVGVIPIGVKDLKIYLKSDRDIDVRLYDSTNGNKAIIGWSIGALIGDDYKYAKTTYNGLTIEYSGYNGDCPSFGNSYSNCSEGKSPGNEYIKISGITKNKFIMNVYGYNSGTAQVNYSYKGISNIKHSGYDSFSSPIENKKRIQLEGILPKGIDNLSIALSANDDIDIELYNADNGDFVVGWKNKDLNNASNDFNGQSAIISSASEITRVYKNDRITWSGWNGRYNHTSGTLTANMPEYDSKKERGIEYIRIHGKSKNKYIMKIYGYSSGTASVKYRWGNNIIFAGILGQSKMNDSPDNKVKIYEAKNGFSSYFKKTWSGLDGYNDEHNLYVAKYTNGLPAITLNLSALSRGGGSSLLCDSGNSQYVFNYIKGIISKNNYNRLYFSGHSSGGGDIQNLMWKFYDVYYHRIEQTFQIDSAELFSGDSAIPKNVKEAFNFYQDEDTASFATEGNIEAEDSSKTVIHNIKISNPTTGDTKTDSGQSPHQRIDNDIRVWKRIVNEISKDSDFQ